MILQSLVSAIIRFQLVSFSPKACSNVIYPSKSWTALYYCVVVHFSQYSSGHLVFRHFPKHVPTQLEPHPESSSSMILQSTSFRTASILDFEGIFIWYFYSFSLWLFLYIFVYFELRIFYNSLISKQIFLLFLYS